MTISENHIFNKYQQKIPLYNQFLPNFGSKFTDVIKGIGANIGDASMVVIAKQDAFKIVGVEPFKLFCDYGISNIKMNNLESRFHGVKRFFSSEKGFGLLKIDTGVAYTYVEEAKLDLFLKEFYS